MTPENKENQQLPEVTFITRVRDESIAGDNPYRWQTEQQVNSLLEKRVVVFSLPGAFTPTCSSTHAPVYEDMYDEFKALGVDEVLCPFCERCICNEAMGR
jgi:peroxiredoxin